MHIKTGDTVEIINGEHKGERGQVQRVMKGRRSGREQGQAAPNDVRIIVAGVNLSLSDAIIGLLLSPNPDQAASIV